jgi:hypothetical protein
MGFEPLTSRTDMTDHTSLPKKIAWQVGALSPPEKNCEFSCASFKPKKKSKKKGP